MCRGGGSRGSSRELVVSWGRVSVRPLLLVTDDSRSRTRRGTVRRRSALGSEPRGFDVGT